jgi:type VI secretion system secreted protein VgrG
MPSPKEGTAGTLVAPTDPKSAQEADVADPGEVERAKAEQQQLGTGKYGQTPVKPFKPGKDSDDPEKPPSWIEIQMMDEDGGPVAGEAYSVELPDGSTSTGTLDEKGLARIEGFDPGNCKITFPNIDKDAWAPA